MLIWEVTSLASRLGICDRPIDVFIEWLKPWLGDWAGFRACADVHERLGQVNRRHELPTSAAAPSTPSSPGPATPPTAAGVTSATPEPPCSRREPKLDELSAEYKSVAESTHKLAESVAGLLVVAIDLAVMALLELQAGGCHLGDHRRRRRSSAVQPPRTIWKIIEIGGKIFDCIKLAEYGAKAFSSGMDGFSVIDPKGPLPTLALGGRRRHGRRRTSKCST